MTHSDDEDDITIISSLNTMDHLDGDYNTALPDHRVSASVPQFQIYSNSSHHQRLPESVHALNIAYSSLKLRFNDLQRKNFEMERRLQSQSQYGHSPQSPSFRQDSLDSTDAAWTNGNRTSSRMEPDSSERTRRGEGLIAHGASSVDQSLELEQENEHLQKKMTLLNRQLREKQAECESLKKKLKDMEDICEQITSSSNAQVGSDQAQVQQEEAVADERDEDTEESETTTELTEKYADMMREIMRELTLSKQTIQQQQERIVNLQESLSASSMQAPASGESGSQGESWERVEPPSPPARTRVNIPSSEPIQCSSGDTAGLCYGRLTDLSERNVPLEQERERNRDPEHDRSSPDFPTLTDTHAVGLDESDSGASLSARVFVPKPSPAPSAATRPKSVTAPITIGRAPPPEQPKRRSLSSSLLQDNSGYESSYSNNAEYGSSTDRSGRNFSESSDAALLHSNKFDVFGRPFRDQLFDNANASLFRDTTGDDLYRNDTNQPRMSKRTAELRRPHDGRSVEPVRQSWPIMSSSTRHRTPPEGAAENMENRYRLQDGPRTPRPLNIDRNIDESTAARSYDNSSRNVNILTAPDTTTDTVVQRNHHQYGILNNDPLAASKPVPSRNIYRENTDLTVRLPPVEQAEEGKTCPMCGQEFPAAFAQSDFEAHVDGCINSGNDSGGDRICPVCPQSFPSAVTQAVFEQHVNGHFEPEENNFEVLDRFGVPGE